MKKIAIKLTAIALVLAMLFSVSGCSVIYSVIPDLCPHESCEETVIKPATCTEKGSKKLICKTCATEKVEEIDFAEHDFSSGWQKNNQTHYHKCKNCPAIEDTANHDFSGVDGENKVCTVCEYVQVVAKGELSFHFMMLGNDYAGDCVYVKAGDNDILIDAGSRANSVDDIQNYVDQYVTDGKFEYVIITHADQDHIAGFAAAESIFDLYECQTIIDFNKSNKSLTTDSGGQSLYAKYLANRDEEIQAGAKRYSALDCYNNQNGASRVYNLTEDGNIRFEVLYNYYYKNYSKDENNYSVCVMFYHGDRQFLFTGDLEKEGEEYLAQKYEFTQVELYKAGHHGSKTSSNDCLLSEIQPKVCVVCCCAGSVEYTDNLNNTFPTQDMINRISPYTDAVYAPITIDIIQTKGMDTPNDVSDDEYKNDGEYKLLNGNIQVISDAVNGVKVECSNNTTKLKDTEWFANYRQMPVAWRETA